MAVKVEDVAERYAWGSEEIQVGMWVCPDHGPVDPVRTGIVPACPKCGRVARQAVEGKGGIVYREPTPATCAGPDRHDLTGGEVSVGWGGSPPGHVWRCLACGDVQRWLRRRGR